MGSKPIQINMDVAIWAEIHKIAVLEGKTVVEVAKELLSFAIKHHKIKNI